MKAGVYRRPYTPTGSTVSINKDMYKVDQFTKCEMCGGDIIQWSRSAILSSDYVYGCEACGFKKSYSHVSFGFYRKIPNYISLTKTHSPENLYFSDDSSIMDRIMNNNPINLKSKESIDSKWNMWIKENTIEIVKLAALADTHTLGSDTKVPYDLNPMIHLKNPINETQGVYLHIITMKANKQSRKQQKIGNAINYGLKNSKSVIWLGGDGNANSANETLSSASVRLHKSFIGYYGYKQYNEYSIEGDLDSHFEAPVYITGPSIFTAKKSQDDLDKYVDLFLTNLNNELSEQNKLKIILNTGNTGIDTSVIRWAIKNNVYSIVVNLSAIMFLNTEGYTRYDSPESAINRILDRDQLELDNTIRAR